MSLKLRAPNGFGSMNLGGVLYTADESGYVDLPDAAIPEALSHGFTRVADALPSDPESLSDTELRAHALTIATRSIAKASRSDLLVAVKGVVAATVKPEGATVELSKGKPTEAEVRALTRPDLFGLAKQLGIKAPPAAADSTVADLIVRALAEAA